MAPFLESRSSFPTLAAAFPAALRDLRKAFEADGYEIVESRSLVVVSTSAMGAIVALRAVLETTLRSLRGSLQSWMSSRRGSWGPSWGRTCS